MITRDLALDIEYGFPPDQLEQEVEGVRAHPMIWHAMWMPPSLLSYARDPQFAQANPQGLIVLTGHINCHDCALCSDGGDIRFGGHVTPWRRVYPDCTDPPGLEDADPERFDDLCFVRDPLEPFPVPSNEVRALRMLITNPEPGIFLPTRVVATPLEQELVDHTWMSSPAYAAMRMTQFIEVCDQVVVAQSQQAPLEVTPPSCMGVYRSQMHPLSAYPVGKTPAEWAALRQAYHSHVNLLGEGDDYSHILYLYDRGGDANDAQLQAHLDAMRALPASAPVERR